MTHGTKIVVVDVDKDEIVKTLEFKSETGMSQYDSVARKVYVNLRNTNEVAEIDPANDRVVGTYPVEGCRYNHGMAVDSEHHLAFLLCNGTKTLTVFALDTHTAIAHLALPAGADVVNCRAKSAGDTTATWEGCSGSSAGCSRAIDSHRNRRSSTS